MRDCTMIRNELLDQMVLGRKYDLQEVYAMIETSDWEIEDCRHKIRAVLENMDAGCYQIVYYGNSTYSLEKIATEKEKEVA